MSQIAGQQVFTGALVSTSSGTAVPLLSVPLAVRSIVIQADPSNVGSVAIGDSGGTLASQTDLQGTIDAKQALALLSGQWGRAL